MIEVVIDIGGRRKDGREWSAPPTTVGIDDGDRVDIKLDGRTVYVLEGVPARVLDRTAAGSDRFGER